MSEIIRVVVDFNAVDATGLVRALLSDTDRRIALGMRVRAYDDDGNECDATVATFDPGVGVAGLKISVATWIDGPYGDDLEQGPQRTGHATG